MRNDPAGPAWSIRPYEPGDDVALAALFGQVFGRPLTVETWRWKLKGLPSPVENVWVAVADADGRVIGQYAGIPARVQIAGQPRPVMISVDTMTSPDFRKRGILTTLGSAIYAAWAAAGIAAVLGLPNQQWGSRTEALGWTTLFPCAWRRAPLHIERALARKAPGGLGGLLVAALSGVVTAGWHAGRRVGRGGGRVQIESVEAAGLAFDQLWARLADRYPHLLVRDAAWVQWRYCRAPGVGYRVLLAQEGGIPAGYIAYRVGADADRRTGLIADLFTAPDADAVVQALLGAALDDCWTQDAETARATACPGSALDRLLQRGGFRPAPGAFDFCLSPLDPAFDPAPLRDPATWLLSGGDFDVV